MWEQFYARPPVHLDRDVTYLYKNLWRSLHRVPKCKRLCRTSLITHISYLSTLITTFTLTMSYKTNFQPARPPALPACLPDLLTDRRLRIPPRSLRLTSYVHLWWQTCIRTIKCTFTFASLVLPNDLIAGRFYSNVLCEWLDIPAPPAVFISHPARYYVICSSRIFSLCSRLRLL